MPSKRPSSNPKTTDKESPRSEQPIDIDDASIDETASVETDEDRPSSRTPTLTPTRLMSPSVPRVRGAIATESTRPRNDDLKA